METIDIIAPKSGEVFCARIEETKEFESARVSRVYVSEINSYILIINYPEGIQYTQWDWDNSTDAIPDDLSEIKWIRQDGTPGIMLNGLPRNF